MGDKASQNVQPSADQFWDATYDTLYDCFFQELLAEFYLSRWQRIDTVTTFLVSVTASGSAVAGWQLWGSNTGKTGWLILAGIASVLSIAHSAMRVPARVKEQERIHKQFCELRIDLEYFRSSLLRGVNQQAEATFKNLSEKYGKCIAEVTPDLLQTVGRLRKVQNALNEILKGKNII